MRTIFNYKEILSVEIAHDYYKNGHCEDFLIQPSLQCSQVLRNCGWIFKSSKYGFKLFADVVQNSNTSILKKTIEKPLKFIFLLHLQNPLLVNFSELPFNISPDFKYYFNNLFKNISSDGEFLLIKKDNVNEQYVSSEDLIQFKAGQLNWLYNSSEQISVAELRFIDSGISIIQNLKNNQNTFPFQFDLSTLPPEMFDVYINGIKMNTSPFYNHTPFKQQEVFAVLELYYSDEVPAEYLFIDSLGAIQPKQYVIPFCKRKTKWRFILNNKDQIDIKDPEVLESEGTWHFSKTAPLIFESDELMPMQETPITGIKLIKDKSDASSVLVESLPNASVQIIRPDKNANTVYSDIYVNI